MLSKYSHTNTLNIDDVLIFNETKTKNLLGKGKGGLSTILHILWSNVHMASVLLTGYAALVLLKDNVHIYNSKFHELRSLKP